METYTIPIDSFRAQFGNMMNLEWKTVKVKDPHGMISSYQTFPINEIKVIDDNGQSKTLNVKPSLEMRVTDKLGKKSVFYFDKIMVQNDTLIGDQSRFLSFIKKEIPLL